MAEADLAAGLISGSENIYYISGFSSGSDARLVVTPDQCYLITDGRYFEQAAREAPAWEVVPVLTGAEHPLPELVKQVERLGFEPDNLSVAEYMRLKEKLSPVLIAFSGIIEAQRSLKDEDELELLRLSAAASDRVWNGLLIEVEPGLREDLIASRVAYRLREEGCTGEAFPTIVASGENGALPHAQAGERRLQRGDLLTVDFGGFYRHYAGDMTRTVAIGELSSVWRERYQRLLEVQEAAVERVQADRSGAELHRLVTEDLARHRLDQYFVHGLGHGLGLAVHEIPRLSAASPDVLMENMVVTVEPGIYIPGQGGIRIEDTVIVKNRGCERITRSDKKLKIIGGVR